MLDGDKLGEEIWAAISALNKEGQKNDPTEKYWKIVGKTIVSHFKTNAVIPKGIGVSTSGGNGATSGPGRIQ